MAAAAILRDGMNIHSEPQDIYVQTETRRHRHMMLYPGENKINAWDEEHETFPHMLSLPAVN